RFCPTGFLTEETGGAGSYNFVLIGSFLLQLLSLKIVEFYSAYQKLRSNLLKRLRACPKTSLYYKEIEMT
ncbi:hypothetical protein, partial [Leptospira interrogans]|uniref:hypothetical protein n=1 Tax=Leptospira interrogans TaxID=173 RepID=UPI000A5C0872